MSYPFQSKLPAPGQSISSESLSRTLFSRAGIELARECQVSVDLAIITLLGAISLAAQGRHDIKMPYGSRKPLAAFIMVVAGSGEGKTPLLDKALGIIRKLQREQRKAWRNRLYTYQGEIEEWNTEHKVLTQAIYRKQTKGGTAQAERQELREIHHRRPEPPREFRLLYEDTTPEALFMGLENATPSAALVTDEAEIFFKGPMNRARGHLNSLWSGGDTIITRATKDDIILDDPRLMLLLMVQPGVVARYMETQGQQARESGLLARFIVCNPLSVRGNRTHSPDAHPTSDDWEQAEARLEALVRENLILAHAPEEPREEVTFTAEGSHYWSQVANEIEMQMAPGGYFQDCPDHGSKLAENIARVAGLLHLFESYEGGIEPETVRMATDICLYYSGHFQQVFMPPPKEEQHAACLDAWFNELRQFNWRVIRYNEVRQRGPRALRNKQDLKEALDILIARQRVVVFTVGKTRMVDLMPWLGLPPMMNVC